MTTIPFQPSPTAAPPFTTLVVLDGVAYTLTTMWSVYRSDWFYSLTDDSGNLIINAPLIGSPPDSNIYLAPGVFSASTLLYRVSTESFEITP